MKKPNIIQTVVSVAACKFTRLILRKTGRGGTAVPGIVAMKLAGNILAAVSEGMQIVVVTGTNGKTTTCNMIEHAITSAGHKCLRDKSGANMLHGIAADLICNATWLGRSRYPYAVIECDEAALKLLVRYLEPKVIVVTNLFSDQVDRYGGVLNTLQEIRTGVEHSPASTLVLNTDESQSASLAHNVPNKVIWYGMEKTVGLQGNVDMTDAGTCPVCGSAYEYEYHIYAHLGGYHCPKCGHVRQTPDVAVTAIDAVTASGSRIHVRAEGAVHEARVALPAVYNVYNAAAAIAAGMAVGIGARAAIDSLATVKSSFGRLETFDLDGIRLQMILVKNPAGCNQAFSYVTGLDEDFTAVLALNNRTGDGLDFSWIEDADYEKLLADPHLKKLFVCGDRAAELMERLERAGASAPLAEIVKEYPVLLEKLKQENRPVYAMPNYTAMMDMRQVLVPATGNKEFWE